MKYLSDYTKESTTKALNKAEAFFAFSDKQFNEAKTDGISYISLGAGLLCPRKTAEQLTKDMDNAIKAGIKQDIKENGINGIIKRELYNYEAFYTGDIEATTEALDGYNITANQVMEVYNTEKEKVNTSF
jgi:hypothetical protein